LKNKVVQWRGSFCGRFYWWNCRGIQTGIFVQWCVPFTGRIVDAITDEIFSLMIPSVNLNISPRRLPSSPLFLLLLPPSLHLNKLSPPKLQITPPPKHPSLLNTNHPSLFFVVTASVSSFIVDFVIFVSKSIFFNFNIKMWILLLLNFFSICILLGYAYILLFFLKQTCSMNV